MKSLRTMTDIFQKCIIRIDLVMALLIAIISIPTAVVMVLLTDKILYTIPIVLIFTSSVIWILFSTSIINAETVYLKLDYKIFSIIFFICIIFLLLILEYNNFVGTVSSATVILTLVCVGSILLQICCRKTNSLLIIIQIIIISTFYVWFQASLYSGVLGIDPWWHQKFAYSIVNLGHIPGSTAYSSLPLFHINNVLYQIISNVNYKFSSIFIYGEIQHILIIIFVFLITKQLVNNTRIGLTSSLFAAIAPWTMQNALAPMPSSFAFIFILLSLFIMNHDNISKLNMTIVLLLLFIVVILIHPITSICLGIMLFTGWISNFTILGRNQQIEQKANKYSFGLMALFFICMFAWWSYGSMEISELSKLLDWGFSRDYFVSSVVADISFTYVPLTEQILAEMGTMILFSLGIMGSLYLLRDKKAELRRAGVVCLVPLAVAVLSKMMGLYILQDRWLSYSSILLSIPMGIIWIKIYYISLDRKLNKANCLINSLKSILFTYFSIILIFLLLFSPTAIIIHNQYFPNIGIRLAVSESELKVLSWGDKFSSSPFAGDSYYSGTVMRNLGYSQVNLNDGIYTNNFSEYKQTMILLRDAITEEAIKLYAGPYRVAYDPSISLLNSGYFKIYCNSQVKSYIFS